MSTELPSSPARERIRKVMRRDGLPDRVPVEIGIGPWYACRLVGATTVDLLHNNPAPQEAMLEAFRRYDYDPWLWATCPAWLESARADGADDPEVQEERLCDTAERLLVRYRVETPLGALSWTLDTAAGRPTVQTERPIKDLEADWPKYRWWMGAPRRYARTFTIDEAVFGRGVGGPGACLPVSWWVSIRQGGIEAATYDLLLHAPLMDAIFAWYRARTLEELDAILAAEPRDAIDGYFVQGSSSSLSHSSLAFFDAYDLPFLQEVTRRTRQAGLPSHLHVCGRSRAIVERCVEQTALDIMEPLEPPPGGDCDLRDLKTRFGDRLVLKGNLNTFGLLTYGTPAQVREAARRCLDDAMLGGGFWLATGDQTPANAPEENLLALIETARVYGKY